MVKEFSKKSKKSQRSCRRNGFSRAILSQNYQLERTRLSADERENGEKQTAIWPFAQETSAYTLRLNQSAPHRNAGQMQTADFNAVSSSQRGPASSASATSAS
ncbi:hypothetical protein SRHO_G00105380 [Serrasalmus rhombeus]